MKIKKAVVNVSRLQCSAHPLRQLPRGYVLQGEELELVLNHGTSVAHKKDEAGSILVVETEEPAKPVKKVVIEELIPQPEAEQPVEESQVELEPQIEAESEPKKSKRKIKADQSE